MTASRLPLVQSLTVPFLETRVLTSSTSALLLPQVGTVGGGLGHDTIILSGVATGVAASFINGGGGTDSINLIFSAGSSTINGGGLADTITLNDAVDGVNYGDATV